MKIVVRALVSIILGMISYVLFDFVYNINFMNCQLYAPYYVVIIIGVVFGIISYFIFSPFITRLIFKAMGRVEERLLKMNMKELIVSSAGLFAGLLIANLIGIPISKYGNVGIAITLLLNLVIGYLGYRVAQKKKEEIMAPGLLFSKEGKDKKGQIIPGRPKVLDTSVIIDGRILDILQTGFVEGKIIIPDFVLQELRHIADSSDNLKRNRGRRGLDILNEIQKQLKAPVEIVEFNKDDHSEVDIKLLTLSQQLNAFVVTNDFNLNKVADFQGVSVLNINELANAIKPVVLPGEEMTVQIIKDGKENGQGIGYLNDGTMIVVEGGHKYIGDTIDVSVTSVLQTAAGRMIFTKKKE